MPPTPPVFLIGLIVHFFIDSGLPLPVLDADNTRPVVGSFFPASIAEKLLYVNDP